MVEQVTPGVKEDVVPRIVVQVWSEVKELVC